MHLLLAAVLAALAPERAARIDAIVHAVMRDEHVAGLSLGIARRGVPLYLRGYGRRSIDPDLPADAYTIYRVGSLTKQFTAVLVLQQVAAGHVDLGAPLKRYLPQSGAAAGAVSIAQLLGQTSGIASYTDRSPAQMRLLTGSDPSPESIWQTVAAVPLSFQPGTQWQYSNTNYLLLGMVLARVTATSYPSLLDERILTPLGLRSTAYVLPPYARNVASGYTWNDGVEPVPMDRGIVDVAFAAGALASNAPDLLAWLEALRSGRALAPGLFTAMATSGELKDGIPTHYGFGFFTGDWYGYRVVAHGGNIDGFSSEDALVLDDGLEIAILTNRDGIDLTPLAKSIVAVIDAPRDANLSARLSQPPENENPRITADVKAIASTSAFASLGDLDTVEFVERSRRGGVTYDRYRLTFTRGQWWMTVGYGTGDTIESLTLTPDNG